jgi:hypothetical protein
MEVSDARRLRLLERGEPQVEEVGRRSGSGHDGSKGTALKKILKPKARRSAMNEAITRFGLSQRHLCRITGWNRSSLQ